MIGPDELDAILGKLCRDAGCVLDPEPAIDVAEKAIGTLIGEAQASEADLVSAPTAQRLSFWTREAFRLAERAGWVAFGSHLTGPKVLRLEFDGIDEDGLPLWERETEA